MVVSNGFDFGMAIIGGVLISLSTSFNLFFKGRITGMSGILYGLVTLNEIIWRFSLIIGMVWTSSLFRYAAGRNSWWFDSAQENLKNLSFAGFAVSGFLVGLGTKMANGCTSGHGVCGLPRLSKRSFVAVGTFCTFGVGIATLRYYKNFLYESENIEIADDINSETFHMSFFVAMSAIMLGLFTYLLIKKKWEEIREFIISFFTGVLFALGLVISGMNRRKKVIGFLTAYEGWDPSLMFVLFSAVTLNFILFNVMFKYKTAPVFAKKYGLPTNSVIDFRLVFGSAIFGTGWGISGLCPGPAFVTFFVYIPHLIIFLAAVIVGQTCLVLFDKIIEKCKAKDLENDQMPKVVDMHKIVA